MTKKEKIISEIAKSTLGLETLEVRNSDSKDFYDLSVWEIEEALSKAFDEGVNMGWEANK